MSNYTESTVYLLHRENPNIIPLHTIQHMYVKNMRELLCNDICIFYIRVSSNTAGVQGYAQNRLNERHGVEKSEF